jgi:hypothetical protein
MTKKLDKELNVMEEFTINFLSPVDRPAQEGAEALFLKRDDGKRSGGRTVSAEELAKLKDANFAKDMDGAPAVSTTASNGHAHLVWLRGPAGETSYGISDAIRGVETGVMHDHGYVLKADGSIEVLFNNGHTHEVDPADLQFAILVVRKNDPDFEWPATGAIDKGNEMTEKKAEKSAEKVAEEMQKTVANLTEHLALTSILAGMSDAEKGHFHNLADTEKAAFVSKGADDRATDISAVQKAADDADPVVFTTASGLQIRKSSGEVVLALAKDADKQRKRADALELETSASGFTKRAESELSHLPGTVAERASILKAVDGIKDETHRNSALAALKAGDAAMSGAFKSKGSQEGATDENAPEAKLDALVKRYIEKHDDVTEAAAYVKVLDTEEGAALYGETQTQ